MKVKQMPLFRPHRGLLEDAMKEVKEINSMVELRDHIKESFGDFFDTSHAITIYKYGDGIDERIDWDTHIVMCRSAVIGFLSGPIEGESEIFMRVVPLDTPYGSDRFILPRAIAEKFIARNKTTNIYGSKFASMSDAVSMEVNDEDVALYIKEAFIKDGLFYCIAIPYGPKGDQFTRPTEIAFRCMLRDESDGSAIVEEIFTLDFVDLK